MTAPAQAERNPPAGACFAKDELPEQAAAPALPIVRAGTGPVILMNETLRRLGEGREGEVALRNGRRQSSLFGNKKRTQHP